MKHIYCLLFLLIIVLMSCQNKSNHYSQGLITCDKYLQYRISHDVQLPQLSVFTDKHNKYIGFQNGKTDILIYDILSQEFVKKIVVNLEGRDAIQGGFSGFYIDDIEHIYIPSLYKQTIHVIDSAANVKQRIDFSTTNEGEMQIPLYIRAGNQFQFIDHNLYVAQQVNPMYNELMMEKSRTALFIDTINSVIKLLPMKFPPLITFKDRGTSAGFGAEYSRCFDGKNFIYSFFCSETLYKASPEHNQIEAIPVKSQYIDKIEVLRIKSTDANEVVRAMCEHPSYGNIVYDKYRKVYYRFAYPKSTLEADFDPFNIYSSGRKHFSIMVLDEGMNIVGETLFPEYVYNSNLYFILEDGLYLSTSHIKNPEYSDDLLTFQRIDLVDL